MKYLRALFVKTINMNLEPILRQRRTIERKTKGSCKGLPFEIKQLKQNKLRCTCLTNNGQHFILNIDQSDVKLNVKGLTRQRY